MRWTGAGLALLLIGGCTDRTASTGGTDSGSDSEGSDSDSDSGPATSGTTGGTDTTGPDPDSTILITANKAVDILFVIDNSGSMGEEQTNLSENLVSLVGVLESEGVDADYRIGFTTTDNGNPWCAGTGPEGGNFVLSSCRSRLQDFVVQLQTEIDATAACTDFCTDAAHAALSSMSGPYPTQPTSTIDDPAPRSRPWVERITGVSNLPDSVDMTQALQCLAPQGISGCGFESHLESMYKALVRTNRDDEEAYGFLRDSAVLSIVILTDEADCSYNNEHQSIFLPDGLRTFWSVPDAAAPTSAVCWNAGVRCEGSGVYDSCTAVDLDTAGNGVSPTAAADEAVLHPLSRYIGLVQGIEDQKQSITPGQEVLVSVITGVPEGYPSTDIVYQDIPGGTAGDPNYQINFGIGPGCTSAIAEAVPPVRLREFAESFLVDSADNNLFSVCDSDYGPALQGVASSLRGQLRPACMPACVADTDPTTPILDPSCALTQSAPQPDGTRIDTEIPPCLIDSALPPDADVCYVALIDSGLPGRTTPEAEDDLSLACRDEGWNLEFIFVRREGVPAPGGTQIAGSCQLSQDRANDCPNLP